MTRSAFLFSLSAVLVVLAGCVSPRHSKVARLEGESVVFIAREPARLWLKPKVGRVLSVRSTYLPGTRSLDYLEGVDYVVDEREGTLTRTVASRIPDFSTNSLYGQREFDHSRFPGFGNNGFFTFVDYIPARKVVWPVQSRQTQFLKNTQAKLKQGRAVRIVAYGDSITAGGDATSPDLIFWQRWAGHLQRKYPAARIEAINGATGGDSTEQGLARLTEKVITRAPDLVLLGFGMNDHNVNGVPIPRFEANLREMISRVRRETGAEIILFSAFPPNPLWKFGTQRMSEYAEATARVGSDESCAYADVFSNWQTVAERKKPEDMLGNDINHPNDFGHWIYYLVLCGLGL